VSDERLWSVGDLAEHFNVHSTTVQGWIRAGHFPGAYKKGPGRTSAFVVPDSAVQEFERKLKESQAAPSTKS